jgi:hypothetical protein
MTVIPHPILLWLAFMALLFLAYTLKQWRKN